MANSRQQLEQETRQNGEMRYVAAPKKLKEKSARSLLRVTKRLAIDNYMVDPNASTHCHIPVCIGYGSSTMSSEDLAALVNDLVNMGIDYTIYAAPRKKFDNELQDPMDVWRQQNAALLSQISHKVITEDEWRKSSVWLEAKTAYENLRQSKDEVITKILDEDVKKYLRRKQQEPAGEFQLGESDIREHMVDCVIDCISWMTKQPVTREQAVTKMNVLIYTHDLPQLMRNALQNANKMGYVQDSLVHVKTEFVVSELETSCRQESNVSVEEDASMSPAEYAQNQILSSEQKDEGLTVEQKEALGVIASALCLHSKIDPLMAGKILAAMVSEFEDSRRTSRAAPHLMGIPVTQPIGINSHPGSRQSSPPNHARLFTPPVKQQSHSHSSSPAPSSMMGQKGSSSSSLSASGTHLSVVGSLAPLPAPKPLFLAAPVVPPDSAAAAAAPISPRGSRG